MRKTRETFLEQAIAIHGDRYGYEQVEYTGTHKKVKILCKVHGVFEQIAKDHIKGRGCRLCSNTFANQQTFVEKCLSVHGYRYDYSGVVYTTSNTPVEIGCKMHGTFKQKPVYHSGGSGCPKCAMDAVSGNSVGWSRSAYVKRSVERYKGLSWFYGAICSNKDERFFKFGISYKGGKRRLKYIPYQCSLVFDFQVDSGLAWDLEQHIHKQLADYRYKPLNRFDGSSKECYLTNLPTHILEFISKIEQENKMSGSFESMVAGLLKSGSDIMEGLNPEQANLLHLALGIGSEAGEIQDAIKKHAIYQKPLDMENVIEELGDLEFYLQGLRQALNLSRDEILAYNQQKLGKRYSQGKYSDQQAQDRADKA